MSRSYKAEDRETCRKVKARRQDRKAIDKARRTADRTGRCAAAYDAGGDTIAWVFPAL